MNARQRRVARRAAWREAAGNVPAESALLQISPKEGYELVGRRLWIRLAGVLR